MKKFKTASGEPPVLHRNTANLMQSMLDEVKANITILPELKALIPPLQVGEYEQLKSNILKDGCREPLLIWQTTQGLVDGSADDTPVNVLIDGHNRHEICSSNGVEFKISLREFPTLQAVRDFMIDNQLGRRNLTPEQMSYLRGLKYRNERQTVGRPVAEEGRSGTEKAEKQAAGAPAERTRDKLAKEFNVSPRTILRDRDYSEGLDRLEPSLKEEVLKGTQKLPKEVVREIGKMVSPEARPLSLADVNAIAPVEAAEPTAIPATVSKEVRNLLKKIAQIAKTLDPNATEFVADCDQLIALLKQAKKQVK
ncbi:hypothetical protein [Rudanella lutea]|uniref:hypothetical protein n=1 Tax=Rudanella lutea TaxID=451374 RepID=UPI00037A2575|nr:hypothetical protein [Rudanella lutea]